MNSTYFVWFDSKCLPARIFFVFLYKTEYSITEEEAVYNRVTQLWEEKTIKHTEEDIKKYRCNMHKFRVTREQYEWYKMRARVGEFDFTRWA